MRNPILKAAIALHQRSLRLHEDERGAGALEYSLVAAVVSTLLVGGLIIIGGDVLSSTTAEINTLTGP